MQPTPHNGGFRMQTPAYNPAAAAYNGGSAGYQGQPAQQTHIGAPHVLFVPIAGSQYPSFGLPMQHMWESSAQPSGAQMGRHPDGANGARTQYQQNSNRGMIYQKQTQSGQQGLATSMAPVVVQQNGSGFTIPVGLAQPVPGQTASTNLYARGAIQYNHAASADGASGAQPPMGQGPAGYLGQSSQTQYYDTSNAPHAYQTSTQMNLTTPGSVGGLVQSASGTQPAAPRRERKPLLIVNPDTDAVVDLSQVSNTSTAIVTSTGAADVAHTDVQATVSAEQTSTPMQSSDIAAQFAAQVAATLTPAAGSQSNKHTPASQTEETIAVTTSSTAQCVPRSLTNDKIDAISDRIVTVNNEASVPSSDSDSISKSSDTALTPVSRSSESVVAQESSTPVSQDSVSAAVDKPVSTDSKSDIKDVAGATSDSALGANSNSATNVAISESADTVGAATVIAAPVPSAVPVNAWSQAASNTTGKLSCTAALFSPATAITSAAAPTIAATVSNANVASAAAKTTPVWSAAASQPAKQPAWGGQGQIVKPQGASKPATGQPVAVANVTASNATTVATTSTVAVTAAVTVSSTHTNFTYASTPANATVATTASAPNAITTAVSNANATAAVSNATTVAVSNATTVAVSNPSTAAAALAMTSATTVGAKTQPAASGTISYSSILRTSAPSFQPAVATAAVPAEEKVEKAGREMTPPSSSTKGVASKPVRGEEQQQKSQDEDTSGDVEDDGWIESKHTRNKKKQHKNKEPTASTGRGPSSGGSSGKTGGAAFSASSDMDTLVAKPNDERPAPQTRPALVEQNGVPEPSTTQGERREWGKQGKGGRDAPAGGHRAETKSVERNWPTQRQENENRGRKGGAQPGGAAVAREQSADSARKNSTSSSSSSSDVAKPPSAAAAAKPLPVWVPSKPPPVWVVGKSSAAVFSATPIPTAKTEAPAEKKVMPADNTAKKQETNKPTEGGKGKQVDTVKLERASAERSVPAAGGKLSYAASAAATAVSDSTAAATTGKPSYAASAAVTPPQNQNTSESSNLAKDSKSGPADKSHAPKRKEGLNAWNKSEITRAGSEEKSGSYASAAGGVLASGPGATDKSVEGKLTLGGKTDGKSAAAVAGGRMGRNTSANEISSSVDGEVEEAEEINLIKEELKTTVIDKEIVKNADKNVKDNVKDTVNDIVNDTVKVKTLEKEEKFEEVKDVIKPDSVVEVKQPAIVSNTDVKQQTLDDMTKKDEKEVETTELIESSSVDLFESKPEVTPKSSKVIESETLKPAIEEIKVEKADETKKPVKKETDKAAVTSEPIEIKSTSDTQNTDSVLDTESKVAEIKDENKTDGTESKSVESKELAKKDNDEKVETLESVVTDVDKEEEAGYQSNEGKEEEEEMEEGEIRDDEPTDMANRVNTLKYEYTEDQWSPLRPEGKKQYDRNFLLALQFANKGKPAELPLLDCVLIEPRSSNSRNESSRSVMTEPMSPMDFTPGYVKSAPSGGRGVRRGGGSMRRDGGQRDPRMIGGSESQQRRIINVPIAADIKLHKTDKAWKAKPTSNKESSNLETEELYKRLRGILNKLTPQNFNKLLDEVKNLPINSEERLVGCNQIIFEKAINEPNYSVAYASMAQRLATMDVPTEANPAEKLNFRKVLLNKCQAEFERTKEDDTDIDDRQKEIDAAPQEKKQELIEELEMAVIKAKARSIGLIMFIGELYKLKMLTEKIMHECLGRLLKDEKDEQNIERLCNLLKTIGQDIDVKNSTGSQYVDRYMKKLGELCDKKLVSSRIRFMICDLSDLRKNNWVPRREKNKPKTIEEIHKDAQDEQVNKELMLQRVTVEPRPRGGPGGQRGGPNVQQNVRPMAVGDDGWTNVSRPPRSILDPSKMKLSKQDENISFGPGGRPFSTWTKGSSGGGSSSTNKETNDRPTHSNRYSALAASESLDSRNRGGRSSPARGSTGPEYRGRMSGPYNTGGGLGSRPSQERNSSREQRSHGGPGSSMGHGSRSGHTSPYNSRSASRENHTRHPGVSVTPAGSMPPPSMPPPSIVLEGERKKEEASGKEGHVSDEREVANKSKSILEEYFHLNDVTEAAACVEEIVRSCRHLFIYHSVSQSLECTEIKREAAGMLHAQLLRRAVITPAQYIAGLKEVVDLSEELVIDIANYWKCLGSLIAPVLLIEAGSRGGVTLGALRDSWESLTPDQMGKLIVLILAETAKISKEDDVRRVWTESGLKWSDLFSSTEVLDSLLTQHKIQYCNWRPGGEGSSASPTITAATMPEQSHMADNGSLERLSADIERLLSEEISNTDICDKLKKLVDSATVSSIPFIRALFTSVCSRCIKGSRDKMVVDEQLLKERTLLLKKYLTAELEIQALYALQALLTKLEHPPEVLRSFFNILYDEDVVSEDAFNQWRNCSDPAHQQGKGVALTSVNQFFQFLDSSDS